MSGVFKREDKPTRRTIKCYIILYTQTYTNRNQNGNQSSETAQSTLLFKTKTRQNVPCPFPTFHRHKLHTYHRNHIRISAEFADLAGHQKSPWFWFIIVVIGMEFWLFCIWFLEAPPPMVTINLLSRFPIARRFWNLTRVRT